MERLWVCLLYGSDLEFQNHHKQYQMSKDLYYDNVPYVTFTQDFQNSFRFTNADEKAYIIQKNFELTLLDYTTDLKNEGYLEDNVCLSGGSFLNVLGNSVLKESGLFNDIHVPPCPNDVGLHFGDVSVSSRRMNLLNFLRTLHFLVKNTLKKRLNQF